MTLAWKGLVEILSFESVLNVQFVPIELCFSRFLVRVSDLEIYNENVRDLLGRDGKAKLEVEFHILFIRIWEKKLFVAL